MHQVDSFCVLIDLDKSKDALPFSRTDWRRALTRFTNTVLVNKKSGATLCFQNERGANLLLKWKKGQGFVIDRASWPNFTSEGKLPADSPNAVWLKWKVGNPMIDGRLEGAVMRFMRDDSLTYLVFECTNPTSDFKGFYLTKWRDCNTIALRIFF